MYYRDDKEQLSMDEFFMPFGGRLMKDNRWVRLAEMMPWEHIEEIYAQNMSEETGRPAIPSRIAFGAIFIKEYCHITDEGTVEELQENPYMQYFVGLHEFHPEPLFDPSMMVHFRKRFPVEEVGKINESVCTGKWPEEQRNVDRNDEGDGDRGGNNPPVPPVDGSEGKGEESRKKGKAKKNTSKGKEKRRKKNRGKLLLDATVAPADIKYPTDIELLNKSREHLETAINILWKEVPHTGHKLPYSAKKARKSYLKLAKSKKWTQAKCRKAIGEQLHYIQQATRQLEKYEALVPGASALYPRWLRDRLDVIPVVYRQQKEMYDNRTHKCENRIVSLEQPHVRRSSGASVPTLRNLGKNCTFPWWMATFIWSKPAGRISTKAVICKPLWRITGANLAAIPPLCWRIKSTRPEPTGPTAKNGASVSPARLWAAEKPLYLTPRSNVRSFTTPVSATLLKAVSATQNAASALIVFSLNWMKPPKPRPPSSSSP